MSGCHPSKGWRIQMHAERPTYARASAGRHGLKDKLKGDRGKLLFEVCIMEEDKVIGEKLYQRTHIKVAG
jgi:hypothetical protein